MKKILAAVDGSTASIHAAKKALELASYTKAEVVLIHVTPPTVLPGDVPLTPMIDLRESELARGARILDEVCRAVEQPNLRTLNLLGAPAEVISDTAIDGGYDLVVTGNKGRNAVSRVLLGSTADRLVHICKKPIMVVR